MASQYESKGPIGQIDEISGNATVTRVNGTTEPLTIGMDIHQGDVVETGTDSAVNIVFTDESSFAVSEDTSLIIDEYVFDPASEAGSQNFSVLKGVFVYTSGLIGRDDPDSVEIDTPVGSIGIRGTIIAGDVDQGEITVVEGAIVLRDPSGAEMTLASQFETGKFTGNGNIQNLGQLAANDVNARFATVSKVAPTLFSSINDAAAENAQNGAEAQEQTQDTQNEDQPTSDAQQEEFDADGATDQDGDSEVDGTVEEQATREDSAEEAGEAAAGDEALVEAKTADTQPTEAPTINANANQNGPQNLAALNQATNTAQAAGQDPAIVNQIKQALKNRAENRLQDNQNDAETTSTADALTNPILLEQEDDTAVDILRPVNFRAEGVGIDQASIAPKDFFTGGQGQSWTYDFSHEFSNEAIRFKLAQSTIDEIESLDSVTGSIDSHSFDESTGVLTLELDDSFSGFTFDIQIAAFNGENEINVDGFQSYTFNGLQSNAAFSPNISTDSNIINGSDSDESMKLGVSNNADNNTVFLGDGNDSVLIGFANPANNNAIYLGEGENTAEIIDGIDNVIFGGSEKDTFKTDGTDNQFHGMDGNDVIELEIFSTTQNDLDKGANTLFDGGAGDSDTLLLKGTTGGSNPLNFTTIDDAFIKGIERLDLASSAVNETVILSYQDVISMTDNDNTLLIRADKGDNINFDGAGFTGFQKTEDVTMDDNGSSDTFNVYTDGTVTLIVEDNGAAVTGI